MAIDYQSDLGYLRLLATDVAEGNFLLDDDQMEAFLAREGHVKLAAAAALDTIASSEVLVAKKISTQDLSTDGPAVAKELRARAKTLREEAASEDESGGFFDVVEFGGRRRRELTE